MVRLLSGDGVSGVGRSPIFWLLLLISTLPRPQLSNAQKRVTLLDCISQELPATISPRFQECVASAGTSGTIYRFITGFECILRLANAILPDRSVDVGTLFAAVGDFKGTRFEKAALECQDPLPAIKFTICMLGRFREGVFGVLRHPSSLVPLSLKEIKLRTRGRTSSDRMEKLIICRKRIKIPRPPPPPKSGQPGSPMNPPGTTRTPPRKTKPPQNGWNKPKRRP